jgi:nicotinamide mononucleotide transporter
MTPLETVAVIFSLLSVVYAMWRRVATWPTGIIGVVAYTVVFARTRLYADMGLQVVFLAQGIYGWWNWRHAQADKSDGAPIATMSNSSRLGVVVAMTVVIAAVWQLLARYTNAASPLWDATVSVLSLSANWLLARRLIENWVLWILADVLYVGLFWSKGLRLSAALYALFLVLATAGLLRWMRATHAPAAPSISKAAA